MADRWLDIGWSVQQPPSFLLEPQGSAPWKIPADVDIVNVWTEYHSLDGGRATGYVNFTVNEGPLFHVASKAHLTTPSWTAVIDANGRVSVNLPATDTLTLTPNPFTYTMVVVLQNKIIKQFVCSMPKALLSVNLDTIAPLPIVITPPPNVIIGGGSA